MLHHRPEATLPAWLGARAPGDVIAFGRAGAKTAADLRADALRVASWLPEASPGSSVLLALHADRYALLAGSLGALVRGHAVTLLHELGREWVGRLGAQPEVAAVLHDTASQAGLAIGRCLAEARQPAVPGAGETRAATSERADAQPVGIASLPVTFDEAAWGDRRVQFCTADGAMGVRRTVVAFGALLQEAELLAAALEFEPGSHVGSTMPLGGRYDFVCGVLLPLLRAGRFCRERVEPAAAFAVGVDRAVEPAAAFAVGVDRTVEPAAAFAVGVDRTVEPAAAFAAGVDRTVEPAAAFAAGVDRTVEPAVFGVDAVAQTHSQWLVTTPAHLRAALRAVKGRSLRTPHVLCSRGPLLASLADECGERVWDVLGSTELGSVALRRGGARAFVALPGVRADISEDGRLMVDSPLIADGCVRPHLSAELAEAACGGFEHGGHVDDVVSFAGETRCLSRMAEELCVAHDLGDAVAVVAGGADASANSASDDAFGGEVCIAWIGDAAAGQALRASVLAAWPRAWPAPRVARVDHAVRTIGAAPDKAALFSCFGFGLQGQPLRLGLEWVAEPVREHGGLQEHRFVTHVPEDYAYFDGHFPGYPILPAAAQLSELILPSVRRALPWLGALVQMSRVKFTARIMPRDRLTVVLRARSGGKDVEAALERDGVTCAGGRLEFSLKAPWT